MSKESKTVYVLALGKDKEKITNLKNKIEEKGHSTQRYITKNTNYVIVGESTTPFQMAKTKGLENVRIIKEDELESVL